MVREELQTEILRLQSELRKTIVFVTHDIDEAVKLGDKVAVFGRGGVLQQYAEPARLLSQPGQRFRVGLRRRRPRLSRAAVLPRDGAAAARHQAVAEADDRRARTRAEDWALVVKPDGTPFGVDQRRGRRGAPKRQLAIRQHRRRRVVLPARRDLRQALDAALSSPTGLGVAVDDGGQFIGGVRADDVLELLDEHRRIPEVGTSRCAICSPTSTTLWALTLIHLRLSLIPIVLGLLIAVPLGALVQRTTVLRRLTTVTASIVFTIPSLALFVVLPLIIPTRILDEANVIVALTLYTSRCWCARCPRRWTRCTRGASTPPPRSATGR